MNLLHTLIAHIASLLALLAQPVWVLLLGALVLLTLLLSRLVVGLLSARRRAVSMIALIDRVSVYALLALILLALYALVGVLLEQALEHIVAVNTPTLREGLMLGVAILVALTYAPLRALLHRLVDTLLYHDYYALDETVQRFSEELASAHDREEIATRLLDGLIETLNLNGLAFIALPEGLDQRVLQVIEPEDLRARREYASDEGRRAVLRGLAALSLADHALSWKKPLLFNPWEGCAALVLIGPGADGAAAALLALGLKRAGSPLRRDDRALLVTLAHQAATALANAQLVEGLRISLAQTEVAGAQRDAARAEQQLLLRELVNADERQRAALARDLHDDALQEVLYIIRHAQLCRRLSLALEQMAAQPQALQHQTLPPQSSQSSSQQQSPPTLPPDAVPRVGGDTVFTHDEHASDEHASDEHASALLARLRTELAQLAERSTIAERKLRALCLGLYPELLHSLGLVAALDDLAEQCALATRMRVEARYDDALIAVTDWLDPEVALHLYRIAQEALNNAHKHGQATAAWAVLRLVDDPGAAPDQTGARFLLLEIADNGSGIRLPVAFGPLLRGGHMGLAGMRERAEQIGARLQFQRSAEGGALVAVTLPLDTHIAHADNGSWPGDSVSAPTPAVLQAVTSVAAQQRAH
ncbi:MAG: ATP-binding protein [Ktedonobacterales bacterium]